MLCAYLTELFGPESAHRVLAQRQKEKGKRKKEERGSAVDDSALENVLQSLAGPIHPPRTSSMGRLFDAVGVLLGFPTEISFEAQNAIALESLCRSEAQCSYPIELRRANDAGPDDDPAVFEIGLESLFEGILNNLEAGAARETIAERFHATVVEMIVQGCRRIRERTGIADVGLSGGCFANTALIENAARRLEADAFRVLLRRQVPANDGGVAFGQIAIAAAQITDD
jgi:hydrogenase maturation protein HypF